MIRFRIGSRVPRNAVNLAYVHSPSYRPEDIALLDVSHNRPENAAAYGGDVAIDVSTVVDTTEILVSRRSILDPEWAYPTPLYYRYRVGRGTYTVVSRQSSPADLDAARANLKNSVQILGRNDQPIAIEWDLDVVSGDGVDAYVVDLYLSRRQGADETFKIKYEAKTGASYLPNHIEVINAAADLAAGTDYTLVEGGSGYTISGLAASSYAPGIGIFYRGSGASGQVAVTATLVRLQDDSSAWHDVAWANKTVAELVGDLNELGLTEYQVVALSMSTTASPVVGSYTAPPAGTFIRLSNTAHVRYDGETRIKALRPYPDPSNMPWRPRISPGEFLQDGSISGAPVKFLFGVPEYAGQTWSYTHGSPYRDMAQDTADVIGEKSVRLHRGALKDGTLVLYVNGKDSSSSVDDVDLLNGVVFLTELPRGDITADYSYEESSYVYEGIDLNTTHLHSPNLFGKYIGIYLTPYKILSSDPLLSQTFATCVRHVIRDTYAEVVSGVSGVLFDDGSDPQAFLIAVFRPVLTADLDAVKIVDSRTRGGGLDDGVRATEEPESDLYWDISNMNGTPFQDKGSLVIAVPDELIGDVAPDIRAEIPISASGYVEPTGKISREFVQGSIDRHIGAGRLALIWPRTGAYPT